MRRLGGQTNKKGGESQSKLSAVDLFCGAGGLTFGLRKAGIPVIAGIDVDRGARFAYETNNHSSVFIHADLSQIGPEVISSLFDAGSVRLLAGCAPCQPFSKLTNGKERHLAWSLLGCFGKIVSSIQPELVTMENVPELATRGKAIFRAFLNRLRRSQYNVDWQVLNCLDYAVPQRRSRLVLVASRLGPIKVPHPITAAPRTVRDAIHHMPPLQSGEEDPRDPLHVAARLTPINLKRVRATPHDGGTWKDWPLSLRLKCHLRATGRSYSSIYGRMWWDQPAPTMTTLCNGLGNGRFGHPDQDRAITLREAALIQSFPGNYAFWPGEEPINRKAVGRLIGNAVPPALAEALGRQLIEHYQLYRPAQEH